MIFKVKEIREGELIPDYYGISYHEQARRVAICHIIPLNIIMRACRELLMRFKQGFFKSRYEQDIQRAYRSGRVDGINQTTESVVRQSLDKTFSPSDYVQTMNDRIDKPMLCT